MKLKWPAGGLGDQLTNQLNPAEHQLGQAGRPA